MSSRTTIIKTIIIALSGAVMTVSCTHKSAVLVTPQVSFSAQVIPILTTYCTINSSCHAGASSLNLQTNFDADSAYYTLFAKQLVSTANPTASLVYTEVVSHEMPLAPYAPLSSADQALILQWIQQGASNN